MADVHEIELLEERTSNNNMLVCDTLTVSRPSTVNCEPHEIIKVIGIEKIDNESVFDDGCIPHSIQRNEADLSLAYSNQPTVSDAMESVSYAVQHTDSCVTTVDEELLNSVVSESNQSANLPTAASYKVIATLPNGAITLNDDLLSQANTECSDMDVDSALTFINSENEDLLLSSENNHEFSTSQVISHDLKTSEPSKDTMSLPDLRQDVTFSVMTGDVLNAPLGSSQNPIRIVQQGNNYTPVQHLTADQLSQIMQVVQQQHVAKNTQESGGSVLFNPSTNTRIVYRVIYPNELHKEQQQHTILHVTPIGSISSDTAFPANYSSQIQRRPYRKRGRDVEEDKVDGPEMSKEEKDERKKHRPRTRSGRVSKPPKHMTKDYKHIHVLDWDEDYDDSDGGYSDFKGSDEEGHSKGRHHSPELFSGLLTIARPKNYKCRTCDKSYIGRAGLFRHFRLNPTHGYLADEDSHNGADEIGSEHSSSHVDTTVGAMGRLEARVPASGIESNAGHLSEDSNTQDSIPSSSGVVSPVANRPGRQGRGGCRGRGRWTHQHYVTPMRRKQKLKEIVETFANDELMEVVLPLLAKFVSPWEFILMKLETCNGEPPRADHIYQEFMALHKQVKQVCQQGLCPMPDTGQHNGPETDPGHHTPPNQPTVVKMEDEHISASLGFSTGTYSVKKSQHRSFHYKYLTSDARGPITTSGEKRFVQVVSTDELAPNHRHKKPHLDFLPQHITNRTVSNSVPNRLAVPLASAEAANSRLSHSLLLTQPVLPVRSGSRQQSPIVTKFSSSKSLAMELGSTVVQQQTSSLHHSSQPCHVISFPAVDRLASAGPLFTTVAPFVRNGDPVPTHRVVLLDTPAAQLPMSTFEAAYMPPTNLVAELRPNSTFNPNIQVIPVESVVKMDSALSLLPPTLSFAPNAGSLEDSINECGAKPISQLSSGDVMYGVACSSLSGDASHVTDAVCVAPTVAATELHSACVNKVPFLASATDTVEQQAATVMLVQHSAVPSSGNCQQATSVACSSNALNHALCEPGQAVALPSMEVTAVAELHAEMGNPEIPVLGFESDTGAGPASAAIDVGEACTVQPTGEEVTDGELFTLHQNATLYQGENGTVILQNPDGTSMQLQGDGGQSLTVEAVQALLGTMACAGEQGEGYLQ